MIFLTLKIRFTHAHTDKTREINPEYILFCSDSIEIFFVKSSGKMHLQRFE